MTDTEKIEAVAKQTSLTPAETEIVLNVLTGIRSHIIGHTEDPEQDARDIDDVIAALRASGQCIVACGLILSLKRLLNRTNFGSEDANKTAEEIIRRALAHGAESERCGCCSCVRAREIAADKGAQNLTEP
jgi:hypothetical protein